MKKDQISPSIKKLSTGLERKIERRKETKIETNDRETEEKEKTSRGRKTSNNYRLKKEIEI